MVAKKYIIGFLATVVAVSGISFLAVSAQDPTLSDKQLQQIRGNCLSTKNTLNQLHASDALLRVNRGQLYESLYAKLMDRFNTRLANNKYNNDGLKKTTTDYKSTLETFRLDYKSYEEQLTKTIDIDCSALPAQFYDAVALSRSMRNLVHDDVVALNQYVDQYNSDLDLFETEYQKTVGESN